MSVAVNLARKTEKGIDDRLATAGFLRRSLNKVFPDHWSFMLGEVALYSFIILLLTGTYLTFFFVASSEEVVYNGSYVPLKGVEMSEAYASTLDISFDVRAGLIMRQIHHWAALLFAASIVVHLMRVFFTGAFRKPREINWLIGVGLLVLAILEGFAGYSLPDDLLSGTGLRIAYSIALSIPVVGTWVCFILFGGEFPGDAIIERLYVVHILLVPGVILALISAHMGILWHQKHTQFPGPGRTEDNVVGSRMFPVYAANGGAFFFLVFGMLALLGGLAQINPIWLFGPYDPSLVSAASQPDWYVGWLDGSTRLFMPWEFRGLGYTISPLIWPCLIMPGVIFTLLALYPWLEAKVTGDRDWHNLLERPRDNPTRTAIGVMSITFYLVLWISGGNDVLAVIFNVSLNAMTWFGRIGLIVLPPIAYFVTKRVCLAAQQRDRDLVEHGIETGIIRQLPHGEFVEVTVPKPVPKHIELTPVESDHINPITEDKNAGLIGRAGRAVGSFFVERKDETEGETPERRLERREPERR
jgi:ubiquinol-cytochrome c reductase cytochrome b subunit